MKNFDKHYDVIIIGAGPVGLMAANLLGQYNIKTLVVEKNIDPLTYHRAVGIDDEALRSLQMIGISKRGEAIYYQNGQTPLVKITGKVLNANTGLPIKDALLDIWQAAGNGLYETQDSSQPSMNLRGKFKTDEYGIYEFMAIYPTSYPVPTDNPVGKLLELSKRLHNRPAHLHFVVSAQNYQTLITEVFVAGDENIKDDSVFSAHERMCGNFIKEDNENYNLNYNFHLTPGESIQSKAPIA